MIRAILKTPGTIVALIVIAVLVGTMIVAPVVLNKDATALNFSAVSSGPGAMHWLGTDALGRDLLARLLVATRLSLGLAFLATLISAVLGLFLGGGVALLPARIRPIGLRFIDTLIAFPALIVAIFVGAIIGAGGQGATIGVGVAGSFYIARVLSALVLSSASRDYILAARILGVRRLRLLLRNILPNVADVLVIVVALGIANSIVFLAAMSFLGLGVQSPQFDWGQLLTEGVQQFYQAPVAALAPAIAIAISALAFGFAGEAVAKSLNPQLWTTMRSIKGQGAMLGTRASKILSQRLQFATGENDLALEVTNLSVQIPNKPEPIDIVTDVSFSVAQAEMLGIVGESGSGKTTVANAISQLLPYPARMYGTVKISGRDISTLSKDDFNQLLGTNVATVFQDPMSSLNPALHLDIQLTERAEVHQHVPRRQARELAIANLKEVNLPAAEGQMRRYPHELSGGMRQRVMMAMGLMTRPALLIADEPTTALDVTIQAQIMDVLKEINQQHKMAIVLISHNLDLVGQNCDRILVMYAGRIVEELRREDLGRPLHPYTQALLGALPDISESPDVPLVSVGGQVPDISNRPTGCTFHPRCPVAVERCKTEVPLLISRRGGAVACWVANEDMDNESA
jgi:oligopeptide/dipeptide ABC transporter ATP-binding protein